MTPIETNTPASSVHHNAINAKLPTLSHRIAQHYTTQHRGVQTANTMDHGDSDSDPDSNSVDMSWWEVPLFTGLKSSPGIASGTTTWVPPGVHTHVIAGVPVFSLDSVPSSIAWGAGASSQVIKTSIGGRTVALKQYDLGVFQIIREEALSQGATLSMVEVLVEVCVLLEFLRAYPNAQECPAVRMHGLVMVNGTLGLVMDCADATLEMERGLPASPSARPTQAGGRARLQAKSVGSMYSLVRHFQRMHALEMFNRDFKMSNVLWSRAVKYKLCDFGMACFTQAPVARRAPMRVTTYTTRAPELVFTVAQNRSVTDPRADIWALGTTLLNFATSHSRPLFWTDPSSRPNKTTDNAWEPNMEHCAWMPWAPTRTVKTRQRLAPDKPREDVVVSVIDTRSKPGEDKDALRKAYLRKTRDAIWEYGKNNLLINQDDFRLLVPILAEMLQFRPDFRASAERCAILFRRAWNNLKLEQLPVKTLRPQGVGKQSPMRSPVRSPVIHKSPKRRRGRIPTKRVVDPLTKLLSQSQSQSQPQSRNSNPNVTLAARTKKRRRAHLVKRHQRNTPPPSMFLSPRR